MTRNDNSARVATLDGAGCWEGMLARCIMSSSQQYLTNVCCANEYVTFRDKDALGGMIRAPDGCTETSNGSDSSTNSLPDPAEKGSYLFENRIIRLAEEHHVTPTVANRALAIVEPQQVRKPSSILEYITKGKRRYGMKNEGKKKQRYTSGHRSPLVSNPNFPDPFPDAYT